MIPSELSLDRFARGEAGIAGTLWMKFNLAFNPNCRARLAEIQENIKTEADLKDALKTLPDEPNPPESLSKRISGLKS